MARIIIPFPLRKYVQNQAEILINQGTLGVTMDSLWEKYPGLKEALNDVVLMSVFVNNKMVTADRNEWSSISLSAEDEVALIIPIAGG